MVKQCCGIGAIDALSTVTNLAFPLQLNAKEITVLTVYEFLEVDQQSPRPNFDSVPASGSFLPEALSAVRQKKMIYNTMM